MRRLFLEGMVTAVIALSDGDDEQAQVRQVQVPLKALTDKAFEEVARQVREQRDNLQWQDAEQAKEAAK